MQLSLLFSPFISILSNYAEMRTKITFASLIRFVRELIRFSVPVVLWTCQFAELLTQRAIIVSINRPVTVGATMCAQTGDADWFLCFADFSTNLPFCQSFVGRFRHRPNRFFVVSRTVIVTGTYTT